MDLQGRPLPRIGLTRQWIRGEVAAPLLSITYEDEGMNP